MALGEGENVCAYCNFDDGFSVEECQDAEKMIFLMDFDDLNSEKDCEDIVNLLPNDPFGMSNDPSLMDFNLFGMDFDIEATFAAITGWMEDFGLKAYEADINDDYKFFAGLNFIWATSLEKEAVDYVDCSMLEGDMDGVMCFGCEKYEIEQVKDESVGVDIIIFVLQYVNLGVTNLLSIQRVCKSLRDAVQNDPYLWTSIQIESPLSSKITDEDLLWLTGRARGNFVA